MATIACDPNSLAKASACFCSSPKVQMAEIVFLLQQIAGNTMTPAQLAKASACYVGTPQNVQWSEITYLLCANVNK